MSKINIKKAKLSLNFAKNFIIDKGCEIWLSFIFKTFHERHKVRTINPIT